MIVLHIDEQRTWRGGEQQAAYLVRGLQQRGHTCIIAGRPGTPFFDATWAGEGPLERVAAPFCGEVDPWSAWRVANAVKRFRVDVIHAHTSHAHTVACMARALAGRGRVIVHRRVDFSPKNTSINRWKYGLPDHYIAVCEQVAVVLDAFGVPRRRISVVHSSIDPARFDVPPLARAELGVPDGVPLVGNVAALVGHKDHANLLAATKVALRAIPNLHLVIAGEGELRPAIEAEIRALGLGGHVSLLGHRTDVPRILRALDAFVLSSYAEGIGGATIEALACELPVVATAAGGVGEVVRNEETGLLVPVRDGDALGQAMVRMLEDRALAGRLAHQGYRMVQEHFTVDALVARTIEVYRHVLEE
ncbi:MAG TPA: glycosyltransferase [Candidatus Hydrogenedentes bacterium]|nr:glycosyltransferase [Candidatus Hydrogenedentota bacterium]HPG66717.1 glycosyltransferase [Candidatus Hydrogenedentota bacterium]